MNRRKTLTAVGTLALVILTLGTRGEAQFGRGGGGRGGGPGGGNGAEQKLVERFHKDGNGRLSREARKAALPAAAGGAGLNSRVRASATATPGPRLTPAQVR